MTMPNAMQRKSAEIDQGIDRGDAFLRWVDRECRLRLEQTRSRHKYGGDIVDAELLSQLLHDAHNVDKAKATVSALLQSLSDLQESFQSYLRPIVTKLSTCFQSLPDELVAQIFKSAIVQMGPKQTILLSHVSQKFRGIVLSEANLWTTLRSSALLDETKAYISRSGDADLYIVVKITDDNYFRVVDLGPFFDACGTARARWKSLSISVDLDSINHPVNSVLLNHLTNLEGGVLGFPRLQELVIDHFHPRGAYRADLESFSFGEFSPSWDAPALSVIRCQDFIPTPTCTAFTSITTFILELDLCIPGEAIQIQWLLEFLGSTPTMTELRLKIWNVSSASVRLAGPLSLNTTQCPSLTSFEIFLSHISIPDGAMLVVAPFIKALCMPLLERLNVSVGLDIFSILSLGMDDRNFRTYLIGHILSPDPLKHRRLESASFDLMYERDTMAAIDDPDCYNILENMMNNLVIPLDQIPLVRSLSVSMPYCATFTGSAHVQYALRELHLKSCLNMMTTHLQELVQSLKEANVWDTLETVTMENCRKVAYEMALEIIGPEKLKYIGNQIGAGH